MNFSVIIMILEIIILILLAVITGFLIKIYSFLRGSLNIWMETLLKVKNIDIDISNVLKKLLN